MTAGVAVREAFLAEIVDNPGDDAARLVFADWLKENGEWTWAWVLSAVLAHPESDGPRLLAALWLGENGHPVPAELIRVQYALREIPPEPPRCSPVFASHYHALFCSWCQWVERHRGRRAALEERERALLEIAVPQRWAGLPDGVRAVRWRGGFVESVACTCGTFLAHAPALFAAVPVTEVRLPDKLATADGTGRACWREEVPRLHEGKTWLPTALAAHLGTPSHVEDHRRWDYSTGAAADAALSLACVTYGRAAAKLAHPVPR